MRAEASADDSIAAARRAAARLAGRMPVRVACATVLVLMTLVLALFRTSYDTNDDVFMTMAAAGRGVAAAPDPHLVFTNVLIGEGLTRLYAAWPGWPWYGLYLLTVHFAAQAAILYCVLTLGRSARSAPDGGGGEATIGVRWGLYLLYFAVVELPLLNCMQFTTTAFVAAKAGVFLFLLAWNRGARRSGESLLAPLTAAVLLTLASGMIRLESLAMALLVAAPVGLLFLREFPRRALAPCAAAALVAAGLVGAAVAYDHAAYQNDPRWREFRSLNALRGTFHDAAWTHHSPETEHVFQSVGWSANDHAMISEWFSDEPALYSREKLQTIVDARAWRADRPLVSLWMNTLGDVLGTRVVLAALLVLPLVMMAVGGGTRAQWAVAGSGAAALVLIAALTWARKAPPERVYFPLMSFPLSACLLSLAWRRPDAHETTSAKAPALVWSWSAWRTPQLSTRFAVVLMVVAVSMGVYKQWRRGGHVARGQAAIAQLLEGVSSDDTQLYVTWEAALPYEFVSPLDSLQDWPRGAMLSIAWPQGTPWQEEVKRRHGVTDVARAIYQRDNVELIARPHHREVFAKFAEEHYGADVAFEPRLEAGDKFVAGRFTQRDPVVRTARAPEGATAR